MALIFDGPNKTIQFDKTDNTYKRTIYGKTWYVIEAAELYSEWKRWCVLDEGTKYAPAFTAIGGETIGVGAQVGTYVFLQVSNGWVLVAPDESDITIQVSGNLYPDIADYPIIEGYGTNSFILIMRNSALTQTISTSGGGGLSVEQDGLLRDIAPSLTTINTGVKKASILVPHTDDV